MTPNAFGVSLGGALKLNNGHGCTALNILNTKKKKKTQTHCPVDNNGDDGVCRHPLFAAWPWGIYLTRYLVALCVFGSEMGTITPASLKIKRKLPIIMMPFKNSMKSTLAK